MTNVRVTVGGRARVEDARGRRMWLCRPNDLGEVSPDVREAIRAANEHRWATRLIAAAIGLTIGVGLLLMIHALFGLRFRATSLAGVVGAIVAGAVGVQFVAVGKAKAAVAACLKQEVCPGCGYSLKGLAAEGDGVRMCPECGGAWKIA